MKALEETDGDIEASKEFLRKKGLAQAEKKLLHTTYSWPLHATGTGQGRLHPMSIPPSSTHDVPSSTYYSTALACLLMCEKWFILNHHVDFKYRVRAALDSLQRWSDFNA